MLTRPNVVGRYAPSPTGDLHLGNIRTALIAWLHTRLQNGQFFLRMEDLDTPRVVEGSADKILNDLEWIGLDWDAQVIYQSQRLSLYQGALETLTKYELVYECYCSRKDIQQAASAPHIVTNVYPGTCAHLSNEERQAGRQRKAPALRVRVPQELLRSCGDFVIKRADGLFAYQLAVVVDDLDQNISHVVRGADLIDSTERQLFLACQLRPSADQIIYHHAPLLCDEQGKRLSKRDGSLSIDEWRSTGRTASQLVGKLLAELGLMPTAEPVAVSELLDVISLPKLMSTLDQGSDRHSPSNTASQVSSY